MTQKQKKQIFGLLVALCLFLLAEAQKKQETAEAKVPEGHAGLIFCSQNLFAYGAPARDKKKAPSREKGQGQFLVERFIEAECDVIALQEVGGANEKKANETLSRLSRLLESNSKRSFLPVVGGSNDKFIRNGFLLAKDKVTLIEKKSYSSHNLPKLQPLGKEHRFSRGPLGVHVQTLSNPKKDFLFFSIHFKSPVFGFRDPTGTNFEALRMEMAEATRELALDWAKEIGDPVLVIAGDRNSDFDAASSEILEGRLELEDFLMRRCRLEEDNKTPVCNHEVIDQSELLPLFEYTKKNFPQALVGLSYLLRSKPLLLDEVLIQERHLSLVQVDEKPPRVKFVGKFKKGSDHKLLKVDFFWQ